MTAENQNSRMLEIYHLVKELDIDGSADDSLLEETKKTQEKIWQFVKNERGMLQGIVSELATVGVYYEKIAYRPLDNRVDYEVDKTGGKGRDNLRSSQVIAETIVGIGQSALPFLRNSNEKYIKTIVARIRPNRVKMAFSTIFGRKT